MMSFRIVLRVCGHGVWRKFGMYLSKSSWCGMMSSIMKLSGLREWVRSLSMRNFSFRFIMIAFNVNKIRVYCFFFRFNSRCDGLSYVCCNKVMNLWLLDVTEIVVPGKKLVDTKANRVRAEFAVLGQFLLVQPQVVEVFLSEQVAYSAAWLLRGLVVEIKMFTERCLF